MNDRLGMKVTVLFLGVGLSACQVQDGGLAGGEPLGVNIGTAGSGGSRGGSGGSSAPSPMAGASGQEPGQGTPSPGGGPTSDAGAPTGPLPTPDAKADPSLPPPEPASTDASAPSDVAPMLPPPVSACDRAARPPVAARQVAEIPRSDEFTFDNDGHLIALSGNDVVRVGGGRMPQLLFRNVSSLRNGGAMRVLPDGDILIADYSQDRLLRVDLNTGRERGLMLVRSPIKMVEGPGNHLYITSNQGNVYRLRPGARSVDVVAQTNLRLGGITFSLDYKTAYVGASDERAVYAMAMNASGSLGRPTLWTANVASPVTLTTDECGNIYVAGSDDGRIRRIGASRQAEIVANLQANDIWALAFGSGKHGWSDVALYALDRDRGMLHEVHMGVKGAPPAPRP